MNRVYDEWQAQLEEAAERVQEKLEEDEEAEAYWGGLFDTQAEAEALVCHCKNRSGSVIYLEDRFEVCLDCGKELV